MELETAGEGREGDTFRLLRGALDRRRLVVVIGWAAAGLVRVVGGSSNPWSSWPPSSWIPSGGVKDRALESDETLDTERARVRLREGVSALPLPFTPLAVAIFDDDDDGVASDCCCCC